MSAWVLLGGIVGGWGSTRWCGECGFVVREGEESTTFIVPSQELEQNVSLATKFQCTAKTSLLCSFHDWMGNSSRAMSKSFTEPSPAATTTWFSCDSDQARS